MPSPAISLPLSTLATEFYNLSRPIGLVIDLEQVQQLCADAARFYAAYGSLKSKLDAEGYESGRVPQTFADIGAPGVVGSGSTTVGSNTEVTVGEWAVIRPLFILYVERENAIALEATRSSGADPYGRSVSEVTSDITLAEETAKTNAFFFGIFTV